MKKVSLTLSAIAVLLLSFNTIAPSTWTLDESHSRLRFSVSHLMVSDVEGSVKMTEAIITASKEDFSDAVVTMKADINSIDTDNKDRDDHLKNADYFDAASYPTAVFKSTSFKKVSDKKYTVVGNLTLHGVTKPVTLEATANYGTNPMSQKTIAGFKVTGTIKRTDFGIGTSTPSAMIGDNVEIVANAEFVKN